MSKDNTAGLNVTTPSDREIVLTRVFDAPRSLVFRAWTDPHQVVKWWGPRGFTTTTYAMDVKPGGVWRFIMHGPDGVDYKNRIVYHEVAEPERLVYRHTGDEDVEPVRFEVTVTFVEKGGKTEVTLRMLFDSAEERENVVEKYGAIEGGKQTLDRLREHLGTMRRGQTGTTQESGAAPKGNSDVLIIERVFDAPRERVFGAWTDPKQVARWWGPHGFTNPVCELDVRTGGAIRIDMRGPDGTVYPMTGVFHENLESERIVFTSAVVSEERKTLFEVLNTVTFAEEDGKTILTLHAEVVLLTPEFAEARAGMKEGWSQSLDRLADLVVSI